LSGTPTAAGTYNFTVTATDTLGSTASQSYTVIVNP
jgi:large repetitive protein